MNNQEQEKPREVTVVVDESGAIEKVASELKKLGVINIKSLENIGCITGQWSGELETIQNVDNVVEVEAPDTIYEAIEADTSKSPETENEKSSKESE